MYEFEQQINVRLQFDAMESPVEISVPMNVLRYLDTHADRQIDEDGMVIYQHPQLEEWLNKRRSGRREFALVAA